MSHIKEIKPSTIKRALRLHREWVEYNECNDPEMPEGREIILTNEIIQKIDFINCNLFSGVDLRKLNASNLDFSKKKFWRADFSGTTFEGANFENSNFEGLLADFVNFTSVDFRHVNFKNTNFANSCFTNSFFVNVYFAGSVFQYASFKKANFNGVDFKYSNFLDVDFNNVDFTEIGLKHTATENVEGFQVVSCQLNSLEENQIVQYWPAIDVVTSGSFSGTLEELKAAIEKTHKNNPEIRKKYKLALEYIENMVKLG